MFKKTSKRRDDRVIPRQADDGDDQSAFTDYVNNQWMR